MKDPGSGLMEAPEAETAEGSKAMEMQMKGRELKVLTSAYLQKLIAQNLGFPELKLKLENDFPGYSLPSEEDVHSLKLREEHANLKTLVGVSGSSLNRFNVFTSDGNDFNRSRFVVSGNSIDEQEMNSNDRGWPHVREDDCIFLVKKTIS